MEAVGGHKKGFKLLRSNSEAIAHKTRMGFNLIEAAIVLAVVGGVVGGIWVAAANMYESHKVSKTVDGVFTIARNIQDLISIRDSSSLCGGGGSCYITNTLIAANTFPKDWINGNTVMSPSGGVSVLNNGGGIERFEIFLDVDDAGVCAQLITKISVIGAMAGRGLPMAFPFNTYTLGFIKILDKNNAPALDTATFPITIDQAVISCSNVGLIKVVFGYTRIN